MAFELHRREIAGLQQMDEIVGAAADRYEPLGLVPETHIHTGFLHLRAYGAAVYSHLWEAAPAADIGRLVFPTADRAGGRTGIRDAAGGGSRLISVGPGQ